MEAQVAYHHLLVFQIIPISFKIDELIEEVAQHHCAVVLLLYQTEQKAFQVGEKVEERQSVVESVNFAENAENNFPPNERGGVRLKDFRKYNESYFEVFRLLVGAGELVQGFLEIVADFFEFSGRMHAFLDEVK